MTEGSPLHLRLARDDRDLRAAQRLRYAVFVEELGASGDLVDHDRRLEIDAFDAQCDHLVLVDPARSGLDDVVAAYRLLPSDRAVDGFYSAAEFDLDPLQRSGRKLLELGRSCVHPDMRGGLAVAQMWAGLADYVVARGIEILFGPASFRGTDLQALAQPLSLLHRDHLAPPELRVRAIGASARTMDILHPEQIDRRAAMLAVPSLIKAYLRLGGCVGDGAWIDHAFNTTDVCLVMDTARMGERYNSFSARRGAGHGVAG
ncbi:GNAT family N-acetyltransferase [Falsirhodobacter halotolerans]|uniref:GNAT family N-acetyltransferase n=1 Tax=Falsirhodobacter halotolerans TaxID=1146892 RepID=UPI001FD41EB0|nr:GNAT family N-acyltransferase [Falsirhodobacter halotolerans]MCJ8139197.1 GNAT family N-acetyltransferase [Falsirhodobacter halotolerans]